MRDPSELPLGHPADGVIVAELKDDDQAMRWFHTERANLLAMQQQAAACGFDAHAWQLAWAADTYLIRRGHRHDLVSVWQIALRAASRLPHQPAAQAHAHRATAIAHIEHNEFDGARRHAQHALDLYARAGDGVGQAITAKPSSTAGRLWNCSNNSAT